MNCIDCQTEMTKERAKNWEVCAICARLRADAWIRAERIPEIKPTNPNVSHCPYIGHLKTLVINI